MQAFHTVMKMHLVREIDEIRQALESDPLNRGLAFPMPQKFLHFGAFLFEILMTSHAQAEGRDSGDG